MTTNTERIIHILHLINTDQRSTTIQNYIEYLLYINEQGSTTSELIDYTEIQFGISITEDELSTELNNLKQDGKIKSSKGKHSLNTVSREDVETRIKQSSSEEDFLKDNFIKNLSLFSEDYIINEQEIAILFTSYKNYIFECFYNYGKNAIRLFNYENPESANRKTKVNSSQILYNIKSKLPSNNKIKDIFTLYIQNIPNISTTRELDYYRTIAERAEAFFALGLSKELAEELHSIQPIKWKIFVDTNFLYSALKVHSDPENPAVDSLLEIIETNKDLFDITLTYLPDTHKEFRKVKNDLLRTVRSQILTNNQIRAALNSNRIDDFTRAYYENQLKYGNDTQHPSNIIEQSINILRSKNIELYNSKIQQIDRNASDYLDSISAYHTYQNIRNQAKRDKGQEAKEKFIDNIEHDVYLREVILYFRYKEYDGVYTHLQECNVFGLTLDKSLIGFDNFLAYKNKSKELYIPTFFNPSYLLNKLIKLLPVQSDDYKKSFLSAVTTPSISTDNTEKSLLTQSVISKFIALGINDLKFMAKCLTSDIFLSNIRKLGDDDEKLTTFIESEASRHLSARDKLINQKTKELKIVVQNLEEKEGDLSITKQENDKLVEKYENLTTHIKDLKHGNTVFQKKIKEIQEIKESHKNEVDQQIPIAFSKPEDIIEKEILKQKILELEQKNIEDKKIEANVYKNNKIHEWQKNAKQKYYLVLLAFAFTTTLATITIFWKFNWSFNLISLWYTSNKDSLTWLLVAIFSAIIWSIAAGYIVILYNRYCDTEDHEKIKSYKDHIELPTRLRN
ncbi:hypothetical protein [Hymenobacter persicinus]|uniref:Uncharacterized protein n=1 Tax=Hymenobacter persicinus TaxID=2025506 RepID=A0A4Q5LC51_9BACT|nr:hypothetical protein [Hymenobacter persicinus]RYU80274.1 hypothetical protein EWM57_08805 [Hymenobacter persicinus]